MTGKKKNRETEEKNKREQKVDALALDLPVDPLQMRAPPIISNTPSAGSRGRFTHTCTCRAHTNTQISWQQHREGGQFFGERRGDRKRGRREIII